MIAGRITCAPSVWGRDARFQFYGEQAVYLSDTWGDLIWLEQFSEYEELKLALRAVRQVSVIQTVAHLSLKKGWKTLEVLGQLQNLIYSGATFVGVMIEFQESLSKDQLQNLIDELGILSLILDLVWEKEASSKIMKWIHQKVPPEMALICGGKRFLPEHIRHFSSINVD